MVEKRGQFMIEPKRAVNENEASEFLKLIMHSEYNIVEQLNQ